MEKKDWKEELWLRVSPTVLEHGKGFGDITLGGATDQQGKENILKAFEQEIDRADLELLKKIINKEGSDEESRLVILAQEFVRLTKLNNKDK